MTCKVSKRKPKVTCTVKFSTSAVRVRATVSRNGRVYVRRTLRVHAGEAVLRTTRLRAGSYRLRLVDRGRVLVQTLSV